MTKLDAVDAPVVFRGRWGEVRLIPGQPVELPDDRATRLLGKAPGRVRVVQPANSVDGDLIGRIVSWDSPLFGLLSATVQEDLPNGVRVIHPLTEVQCVIPTAWLCL